MAVPEHSDCDAADQERADLKAEVERLTQERDELAVELLDRPGTAKLRAEVERLREAEEVLEALVASTDLRKAPDAVKDRIGRVIRAKHAR